MAESNIIGSLIFCPECGSLMDTPGASDDLMICIQCSHAYNTAGYENTKVVTASSEHAFQSALKAKRHLVQQDQQATEAEAMIKEKCPNCGNPEMAYHTMQLRSADEGQTVFYNCKKCGYKYSVNN
ncbi:transcription factor S-II-domain-containing protein [Syncephalastrum racemosum]|uniref:DNA-directed RNA polymerase subunit n=1 Tax=Syncephalastrum racemosum TaxID=13706 RepID=A0A1X2H0A6_SYNRA|nr:transcription factor S-II-domain-containing protein [Syncephalastrum racemosum]